MPSRRGEAEAKVVLTGEDAVSAIVERVEASIRKVGRETEKASKVTLGFRDSWSLAASGIDSALNIASRVAGAIGDIGAAMRQVGQQRAIESAFASQFRETEDGLAKIRTAVGGLVDDVTIQRQATALGRIGLTAEETAELMSNVAKAAQATGQDVAEFLDKAVEGVAGRSSGWLEDLGLAVDFGRAVTEQNKELGRSLSTVEEQMLAASIATKELNKEFGSMQLDTVAAQTSAAAVQFENLKASAREAWVDGVVFFAEKTGLVVNKQNELIDQGRELAQIYTEARAEWIESGDNLEELAESQRLVRLAMEEGQLAAAELARIIGDFAEANDDAVSAALASEAALWALDPAIRQAGGAWEYMWQWVSRTAEATDIMNEKLAKQSVELQHSAYAWRVLHGALKEFEGAEGKPKPKPRGRARRASAAGASGFGAGLFDVASVPVEMGQFGAAPGGVEAGIGGLIPGGAAGPGGGLSTSAEAGFGPEGGGFFPDDDFAKMAESADALLEPFNALEARIQALSESFPNMTGEIGIVVGEFDRMAEIIRLTEEAGGSLSDAMIKGAPGMIAAAGKVSASFVGNKKDEATILAVFEAAAAIASFAQYDYYGGALHTAAAIQYGIVAGTTPNTSASGGGGRTARPPQLSQPAPVAGPSGPGATFVSVNAPIITQEGAREVRRLYEAEKSNQSAVNPEFMSG